MTSNYVVSGHFTHNVINNFNTKCAPLRGDAIIDLRLVFPQKNEMEEKKN